MSQIKFIPILILILNLWSHTGHSKGKGDLSKFDRLIYIVLENKDYRDVIKNATFKKFLTQGASFSQFYAETHPSQPNYIAMIAGDTLGVNSNSNVNLTQNHLGDLLEEGGIDWRVYAENYPGKCFLKGSSGSYARKHVPFLSFINVQNNAERCAKVQNFDRFAKDWRDHKLPAFTMIIPNNKNNGHDTNIETSARWFNKHFESFINDPSMMEQTLIVITYDEGSNSLNNKIYTVFLGPSVTPGSVNEDIHSHYSLLRLMEEEWDINSLGLKDVDSPLIHGIWK